MPVQLDRRPPVGGSNRGGITAPPKLFSKLLQNSRVLLQAFPNKALAVLGDFKGLQGFQTSFDAVQIFRPRSPHFRFKWAPGWTWRSSPFPCSVFPRSSVPSILPPRFCTDALRV